MQLVHDFVVPRPIETAWNVLTDLERVAPCMPGAQLQEIQGDTYRGTVRVKVGPILAQFGGVARFKELDQDGHRAVIEARGKEAGGKGLAAALITAELTPEGDRTAVHVVTDLTLSGRIAQFGRGAIGEVSAKLLGQFARCLESTLQADSGADPAGGVDAVAGPTKQVGVPEAVEGTEVPPAVAAEPVTVESVAAESVAAE
ncbi:MAG: SRPBCC family protein, partial [Sporichthyaceae bacterium]|nr:SRPBCC family protein [Sporichthyaceae bacterium]